MFHVHNRYATGMVHAFFLYLYRTLAFLFQWSAQEGLASTTELTHSFIHCTARLSLILGQGSYCTVHSAPLHCGSVCLLGLLLSNILIYNSYNSIYEDSHPEDFLCTQVIRSYRSQFGCFSPYEDVINTVSSAIYFNYVVCLACYYPVFCGLYTTCWCEIHSHSYIYIINQCGEWNNNRVSFGNPN